MKRRLLTLAALLAWSSCAHAAVTEVQKVNGTNTAGSFVTTTYTTANNTAGDDSEGLLTVLVATGTVTISSINSSLGNSYSVVSGCSASIAQGTGTLYSYIIRATSIAGGGKDAVTVNLSANSTSALTLYETTPGAIGSGAAFATTGTSANPSAGTFSTSNGSFNLMVGNLDDGNGFGTGWFVAGTGWTLDAQFGGGSNDGATESWTQATGQSTTYNLVSNFPGITGPWVASGLSLTPPVKPTTVIKGPSVMTGPSVMH